MLIGGQEYSISNKKKALIKGRQKTHARRSIAWGSAIPIILSLPPEGKVLPFWAGCGFDSRRSAQTLPISFKEGHDWINLLWYSFAVLIEWKNDFIVNSSAIWHLFFKCERLPGSHFVFFERWERRINSIIIDNGISAACNTWLSSPTTDLQTYGKLNSKREIFHFEDRRA